MKQFTWIPIYEEIGQKLLTYINNKEEVLNKFINICKKTDLKLTGYESNGDLEEIDPFTIMASFNRGQNDQKRIKILT